MQTLLSRFCEEFNSVLRPVLEPLRRAADTLSAAAPGTPGKDILHELHDARHQVETLADKVEGQQAYVLIFGPLKSGKSTLMNAVSAAYVSEVTSLPAYPCMVYVSHADSQQFKVHLYDGQIDTHSDPTALHMQVNRAHTELADRIREIEGVDSSAFDPAEHMPEAIRRVDVKVPAGHLARSGAVLVDTPGLYSRMKFGYDRMTREFRNAAACAIFVVKSDNLFLEQVFAEFNQLLELFSRIFLVVNLDTGKLDLRPDGNLEPSLERRDPLRIIDAFENLAMSAPLKKAADEGRLRIYPVDLLRAASERLQSGTTSDDKVPYEGQASFDAFLGDLTEYLNSTEYLVAFLGDSLRQATAHLGELRDLCSRPAVDRLRERVEELETKQETGRLKIKALERLGQHDWAESFGVLEQDLQTTVQERSREAGAACAEHLDGAVNGWFQDDTSLQTLMAEHLVPILTDYRDDLAAHLRQGLAERVDKGQAGVLVPSAVESDLRVTDIALSEFGEAAVETVHLDSHEPSVGAPLDVDEIPVRRGIFDWLLFRGQAVVRRRVLGPSERPNLRVPRGVKQRRLGEVAREAILGSIERKRDEFSSKTVELLRSRILEQYSQAAIQALRERLQVDKKLLTEELTDIDQRLKEHRKVLNHLTTLQAETDGAMSAIDALSESYGQTDPTLLNQPLEEEEDLFEVTLMPATGTEPAMEMTPEATPETTTEPDTEGSPEEASEELELRGED